MMTAIAAGLCLAVFLLFKEFKLLAFDPGFGAGLGLPMGVLDLVLNLLVLLAVVIGLQSVGVVLMAAMLITPAIAARYWTDRLGLMTVLAGLFGAASGALGTLLSQLGPRMPTGPLIVLAATLVFLVSLFFAPRRGLLARLLVAAEKAGWVSETIKSLVLQALVFAESSDKDQALQAIGRALALAEPGGFIRLFVDEGEPMRLLILDFRRLAEKQPRDRGHPQSGYLDKLLAAFAQPDAMPHPGTPPGAGNPQSETVEPLSQRELEILRLIAQGLSNQEIGSRLFLALNTVKGHNRVIFDKLQVQNRTEAVAQARELGLL
jgi:DNA-binding CsgD family transcriptional regulator